MGKRVRKYAGHAGLGAELRRLRGGRSLDQIVELSKTPPLAERVKPISAPTLSLIENGISMPTLDTLYTLSVIYKTPLQRLYDIVGMERMLKATDLPETLEETREAYRKAFRSSRWFDALALALHAERVFGSTVEESARWRLARASALSQVGFATEALQLLLECADGDALPSEHLYVVYRNLASAHLAAGQPRAAALAAREALRLAPDTTDSRRRFDLQAGLLASLLAVSQYYSDVDTRELRAEINRVLSLSRAFAEESGGSAVLLWGLYEAALFELDGNHLMAAKRFKAIAEEAGATGCTDVERSAWQNLGELRRSQGKFKAAIRALERAEQLAFELADPTKIFDASLEVYLAARGKDEAIAERYWRKCERYYPMVNARTQKTALFERLGEGPDL